MIDPESSSPDEGEDFFCNEILNENVFAADSTAGKAAARVPTADSTSDAFRCIHSCS